MDIAIKPRVEKAHKRAKNLILFSLILLLSSSQCSNDLGSGSIDGLELGKVLGMNLDGLARYDSTHHLLLEQVNSYFNTPLRDLDSMRIYGATTILNDELNKVAIVVIPLKFSPFVGANMVTSVVKEKVHKIRIWGNNYANVDADASIEEFCRQFDRKARIPELNEILTEANTQKYIDELDGRSTYLFDHALAMRTNSYLIRHTMARTSRGKIPEVEWYEGIKHNITKLDEEAHNFDKIIDDAPLAKYREQAKKSASDLGYLINEIKSGASSGQVRSSIKDYRKRACTECHNIEISPETRIFDGLRDEFFKYGFRTDLYRVGVDVWAVPEYEKQSQLLANIVKAELIYVSLLKLSD